MATAIAGGVGGCSIVALSRVPAIFRAMRARQARTVRCGDSGEEAEWMEGPPEVLRA
jgi:hypothetical protein